MRLMRFFLLFLGALAGFPAVSGAGEPAKVLGAAISSYFVPGYQHLADSAAAMAAEMDALCADPSEAGLESARTRFDDLVHTWARVDLIRFGPAVRDNRLERVLFWPDRRSIALKQVQAALAEKDQTVLSLETLTQKSVGLQGLGPLEFILFGTGSADLASASDGYRCGFGGTIARNIEQIGSALAADWQDADGIARRLAAPDPDYPDYRTTEESLGELVGIFSYGVERMRASILSPILGEVLEDAKPRIALFRRSGLTVPMLAWQMEGLRDLFTVSDLESLFGEDARWIAGGIDFEFGNFANAAARVTGPIEAVLADPEGWSDVDYLRTLTYSIEQQFGAQVAEKLGIDLGFSALDGD